MSPDDPRHGEYAGYMKHKADDESACEPCLRAHRRLTKSAKIRLAAGIRNRIPLGDDAWNVLNTRSCGAVALSTGLSDNNLRVMHRAGPEKMVLRTTRDAILAAGTSTPTYVGIQRRLRALSALGYAMTALAPHIGAHEEPLVRMMRRDRPPEYVRARIVDGVVRVYADIAMNTPPTGRFATRQRTMAGRRGWVTPLAWDDIDDPDEQPSEGYRPRSTMTYDRETRKFVPTPAEPVDESVVLRLLSGDTTVTSSRDEKVEAMRRWLAWGKSEKSLCAIHGWKDNRYTRASAESAA